MPTGKKTSAAGSPPRIALFAIPHLPPLYLEILLALSAHIDIRYYLLNPCREYWADIVTERDLARLSLAGEAEESHHEIGHPLLAAWGRQPQQHLNLVAAVCGEESVEQDEHYEDPAGVSLLALLQRSVLDLDDLDGKRLVLSPHEHSVQVHVCHSLIRELEVLHDQLLSLFDVHPGLSPADIVVMTPDLEIAAPHIDAVFGSAQRERYIPFGITGRASPSGTPLLRAYATLLGLPRSRFEASIVMELIETPAVARRFDLGEADLACIRVWLRESGVRWGRDAEHRAALALPAERRHTWADSLARLVLGYALPGGGRRTFAGVLPYDDIEGSQALALGKLCTVFEALEGAARDLAIPRPPAEWATLLIAYTDRFLLPAEDEQGDLKRIRSLLTGLGEDATLAAAHSPVGVEVIAALLTERLMGTAPGASPTGAVTFCGIGSLRGIPFRVVCLFGLADTAFPRQAAVTECDLMAERPRLGDRARRHDDRAAFLDALLSAREVLYLSYPGHNVRDDSLLPPAIPVSELLDYLGRSVAGGADAVRRRLVTEHRLQPWSPHYFRVEVYRAKDGQALFSYAADYAEVAKRARTDSRSAARPLFIHPLPEPGPEWRQVEIDRLIDFFSHPIRFLLRERLGIHLGAGEAELPDQEPFQLGRLDGSRLAERLLPLCLAGTGDAGIAEIALAGSELPHGAPGRIELRNEWRGLARFRADLIRLGPTHALVKPGLDALPFALVIGEVSLTGSLSGLHRGWPVRPSARHARGFHPVERVAAASLPVRRASERRRGPEPLVAEGRACRIHTGGGRGGGAWNTAPTIPARPVHAAPLCAAQCPRAHRRQRRKGPLDMGRQAPPAPRREPGPLVPPPLWRRPGRPARGVRDHRPRVARSPLRPSAGDAGLRCRRGPMSIEQPVALGVPLTGVQLIEASAGTGKTWTLSGIFLRLVVETDIPIGGILAVTFTRAATAELRERIRGRLGAMLDLLEGRGTDDGLCTLLAARLTDTGRARLKLRAALYGFDDAALYTIHGFCQRVLRDRAFASAMPFETEVLADASELLDAVVADFWRHQIASPPIAQDGGPEALLHDAFVAWLLKRGITPESCAPGSARSSTSTSCGSIWRWNRQAALG